MGIFSIIGVVLAILISWTAEQSILWAIIHAVFGWTYIIYFYAGIWVALAWTVLEIAFFVLIAVAKNAAKVAAAKHKK